MEGESEYVMMGSRRDAEERGGSAFTGTPRNGFDAGLQQHQNGRGSAAPPVSAAEMELRQVAETLSRTGKVLSAGLTRANEQGQRLRGAISRLERANEWSTAERKRGEDEISSFFNALHEALRAKEDEMLRDTRGVYAVQDEDNKRRLEELVIQGQKLSKACMAIQALHEGTSNATIGSLNSPLNALLESLESSGKILDREDELAQNESVRARPGSADGTAASGSEERGVKFHLCNDQTIQRGIESIEMVQYESALPPLVLVGTPAAVEEEARRRKLAKGSGQRVDGPGAAGAARGIAGLGLGAEPYDFGASASASASPKYGRGRDPYDGPGAAGGGRLMSPGLGAMPPVAGADSTRELKVRTVVPYDKDSENKGVLHYLGTKGNTQVFSNPALFSPDDAFLVVLRGSSRIEGDLASLAGFRHYDGAFFETDSALSSWVSIELPGLLAPTHYTLGYYISGQDHIPRNWVLQGSKDNVAWKTIKVHENDTALDGDMHLATWRIPEQANAAGPFRFFRIMQTGPTSSGTMFLVLSFIDFYGTLFQSPETSD